jgi:hypothetical protein
MTQKWPLVRFGLFPHLWGCRGCEMRICGLGKGFRALCFSSRSGRYQSPSERWAWST